MTATTGLAVLVLGIVLAAASAMAGTTGTISGTVLDQDGRPVVSATVLGPREEDDAALEKAVREQMTAWFGASVDGWRHLRTYRIEHALPAQPPGVLEPPERPVCLDRGLFVCGDHRDNASIDGAMASGHRAAEAVLASRA